MHATKCNPQLRLRWQSIHAHRLASMPPTPGVHHVVSPSRVEDKRHGYATAAATRKEPAWAG